MAKHKTLRVDMDIDLFRELLILCMNNPEEPALRQLSTILQAKLDRMVERDLYGQYKTAPTEEERELARQEYLNRRGIPDEFRW